MSLYTEDGTRARIETLCELISELEGKLEEIGAGDTFSFAPGRRFTSHEAERIRRNLHAAQDEYDRLVEE
jgi:hypothetical protein